MFCSFNDFNDVLQCFIIKDTHLKVHIIDLNLCYLLSSGKSWKMFMLTFMLLLILDIMFHINYKNVNIAYVLSSKTIYDL